MSAVITSDWTELRIDFAHHYLRELSKQQMSLRRFEHAKSIAGVREQDVER
jgi:hypothetical protein